MPKRIEFIAPVEAIRGQLSGRQDLLYAENDNKAYEGPVGSKNYARNYTPRFVGAKIASSGKKYFSVRTKSCNHLTAKAKKAMALLGGAGALYAGILAAKGTTWANLYAQYIEVQALGETRSFRTCIMEAIRVALIAQSQNVTYSGPRGAVTFKNPWYNGEMTSDAMVSQSILVKFWAELAPNGIVYTIDGMKGIAQTGDDWDNLINNQAKNILGVTRSQVDSTWYVKLGARFIMKGTDFVPSADAITASSYITTDETPE